MSGGVADLSRLYLEFAVFLEHIVRGGVQASDDVIEEACQTAWARLVSHRHRIADDHARGWLARTAVHEALRLHRRQRRDLRTETDVREEPADPGCPVAPEPQSLVECRQRLESVRQLPRRQQRIVWLRALGLSYEEMAAHEGCTSRTVERQLERARRGLRVIERGGAQLGQVA